MEPSSTSIVTLDVPETFGGGEGGRDVAGALPRAVPPGLELERAVAEVREELSVRSTERPRTPTSFEEEAESKPSIVAR